MKEKTVLEGTIEKVLFPNKGIMNIDNKIIHVRDTLVGQQLRVELSRRKRKGMWEGKVLEVLNPEYFKSADCKYYGQCGGCNLQQLPYEQQLTHKYTQVKMLLEDLGEYEDLGIVSSPSEFEYRNKMEFSFGNEYKDGPITLGMHKKRRMYDIITMDGCKIVNEDFSKILRFILSSLECLPFYDKKTHTGYLRYLLIRKSEYSGDLLVNLVTSSQVEYDFTNLSEQLTKLDIAGKVIGFLHTLSDTLSDAVKPESIKIVYGQDYLEEKLLGLTFNISSFSFFQTNTKGAEVLYTTALGLLENLNDKVVFDLYSGTGTIAQIVATQARKVYGIEIVEEAVNKARENATLNKINNCTFLVGDVLELVEYLEENPDIIVLDPPREGIHPKAIQKIINFRANEILYISCKPTSLARDLVIFKENGYKIEKICCVDMFPQTNHIETICLLSNNI
ncbi:23S rRNA (uracil-5-)-methyltransferase RumA [Candidatus Epulonipiscium fishelsonii]|uniref:23S rRNA (Uracil-5-)-methyltransferase RumA n=1 Tax=Candidatus Epulonipiscium fishelsonii TaxID=77094 RepID=A0ACC8X8C0_9FIRM|nr:23S rRNA (uracil-5-)-methyltransferase RumA [Epulopiscium sp. SCG-B11WGA-EpuloA1]ONI43678.1 23S rRNA (uracil-5-)-methyltransferase RumA [Epulopiscium sp. SCG-B05WGA-EpuloA1]